MAFTYSDALSYDRDKVRFHIGDTQEDAGPRPDKRNFSDNEIAFALDTEDDRINGTVAYLLEILANEWTAYAIQEREGEVQMDAKEVAANYREQAAFWRTKPGGADEAGRSTGLITLTREDAYS